MQAYVFYKRILLLFLGEKDVGKRGIQHHNAATLKVYANQFRKWKRTVLKILDATERIAQQLAKAAIATDSADASRRHQQQQHQQRHVDGVDALQARLAGLKADEFFSRDHFAEKEGGDGDGSGGDHGEETE